MIRRLTQIISLTPLAVRVLLFYGVIILGMAVIHNSGKVVTGEVYAQNNTIHYIDKIRPIKQRIERGVPTSLTLPRLGIAREIIAGTYDYASGEWTLTNDKAQFAVMTSELNSKSGQTVIYGHNTNRVLAPVKDVMAGEQLLVSADSGKTFVYAYVGDRFVEPTDVSVLTETSEKPQLVLMTCEGLFNQTRRLLYFAFKEVV